MKIKRQNGRRQTHCRSTRSSINKRAIKGCLTRIELADFLKMTVKHVRQLELDGDFAPDIETAGKGKYSIKLAQEYRDKMKMNRAIIEGKKPR